MAERRCGTCEWWKQSADRSFFGDCEWGDGIVPEWAIDTESNQTNSTTREFGKDCPTWHPKTT